jgi:hypothetical protein
MAVARGLPHEVDRTVKPDGHGHGREAQLLTVRQGPEGEPVEVEKFHDRLSHFGRDFGDGPSGSPGARQEAASRIVRRSVAHGIDGCDGDGVDVADIRVIRIDDQLGTDLVAPRPQESDESRHHGSGPSRNHRGVFGRDEDPGHRSRHRPHRNPARSAVVWTIWARGTST